MTEKRFHQVVFWVVIGVVALIAVGAITTMIVDGVR